MPLFEKNMLPLDLVHAWPKRIPGIYEILDLLKASDVEYPDYCLLPISAARSYLVKGARDRGISLTADKILKIETDAPSITACWQWRQNKVIYKFDLDLARTLADQGMEDTEVLPVELLMHPPYPIVYIQARGLMDTVDGFFCWLDYNMEKKLAQMQVLWVDVSGVVVPQALNLLPDKSIKECLFETYPALKESKEMQTIMTKPLFKAIQLVLYLASQNADIEYAYPRKRRKYISDSASEIQQHKVGVRIGATIRKTRKIYLSEGQPSQGGSKRSHSRRGHWHHFWTGPRNGDRELILKWVAPTYIHAGGDEVVVYPVKE